MLNSKEAAGHYKTDSKSYRAFMEMLRRQYKKLNYDETSPGVLASLYLDCFLLYSKKICSDSVVDAGLCERGKFTEWRKEQKRLGNLDWDVAMRSDNVPEYTYKAGAKTAKHIDTVGREHGLMASKDYVDKRIDELRAELLGVIETVKTDYFKRFPPRNDEREAEFEENLKGGKPYIESDQQAIDDRQTPPLSLVN